MILLFWVAFVFIFYTYFGYPLILFVFSQFINNRASKQIEAFYPSVTVLIAAKNEERCIASRIENLLKQEYPQSLMEIIIVSDGSVDNTVEIVEQYIREKNLIDIGSLNTNHDISLIVLDKNKGKPNALNIGIEKAFGEIIVFADARQYFELDVIKRLAANFIDKDIGCVSGKLVFSKTSGSLIQEEMGLYWNYEKAIRKMESLTGSVVGATGAIYAIRKSLYVKLLPETLLDDVVIPMNIVLQNYKVIFDSNAVAYDVISSNIGEEWKRKVRTLAGNWQLLNLMPVLFSPMKNPIWWRFISHKIFRLFIPFALMVLFYSSITMHNLLYSIFAFLQIVFYGTAIYGWLVPSLRKFRLVNFSFFFLVLNLAVLKSFQYWITGNCSKVWKG